jgi:D-lactate dehydrogenase
MTPTLPAPLDAALADAGIPATRRPLELAAAAHDASHYRKVPQLVARPRGLEDVAALLAIAARHRTPVTFRAGGTSLSGQGVTAALLADTRRGFRDIRVGDDGRTVTVGPGATVRQVNARLARHRRKLGPDPASEIACTIGGVVANNSSGMACGVRDNSYRTVRSLKLVLPSGTIVDTAAPDADERLREREPELHAGLLALRARLLASSDDVATVRRLFAMKNTMGYGVNALLDFERAVDILSHLVIGSEGTLAFVAEAVFETVEVLPEVSTGLLVFPSLRDATAALPALVAEGLATIELLDARSLRVAQQAPDAPAELVALEVDQHAAFLVEVHERTPEALAAASGRAGELFATLPLAAPARLTTDAALRAALWHIRKGLYAAVAGARPSGTTALLEDVVVPTDRLLASCERLQNLLDRHGYEESVIFGHAKDGNIHFMLNERFDRPESLERYRAFTEDLVELILSEGGSLKAEHGTGRVMAPFVRRQYGDGLYEIMREIKRLCDRAGILNPGVVLSDDPDSYLADMKIAPQVESEVDRCVECGYCEPFCPSKDLTLTPRQRIVLRREQALAEGAGDERLAAELRADYEYDGVQSCAVDGMCATACPVGINTGDLVRRLRAEEAGGPIAAAWSAAATGWGGAARAGGLALTAAKHAPAPLVTAATRAARAVFGAENVPLYDGALPAGGVPRSRTAARAAAARGGRPADAVFFAACIGTMFGPEPGSGGAAEALFALAERACLALAVPEGIDAMCCGTPWKSKGYLDGHHAMAERVLPALLEASDAGRLPVVCDAASCTEGLEALRAAAGQDARYAALRFIDATQFVHERVLERLAPAARLGRVVLHPTCSTTALGANAALEAIARFLADEVHVPQDWGCCAFAGDRGLLHPELTASATAAEAREVATVAADAYLSANRTCELGMSRATGRSYRHVLEALEQATRPAAP